MKKYNILSTTVVFIMISLIITSHAKALKTCAIVPFGSASNKNAAEITAMRSSYEQLVNASGKYNTIDNSVNKLIKNEYFGKKYTSVTSAAMNAGIILNADYVIYGQVTKSKNSYTLTTTLVDIHESKAVRSIRSKVDGDINEFVKTAPASNMNALLGIKTKPETTKPPEVVKPNVAIAAPAIAKTTPKPTKKNTTVKKKEPKATQKKKSSQSSSFDWAETFSWADQTQSRPDFNKIEYENEFMQYLDNHLEIGFRTANFSLEETQGETNFLGTINLLVAEETGSSMKLFVDWMINPYLGIELTSDEIGAKTYTDTEDNHSDGVLSMSGPVVYIFGRYPFQIKTEKLDFIIAPYLGIGMAFFSSEFKEDTWWSLGYGSPALWEDAGSPTVPTGDYSRKIDVTDSSGTVIAGGCTIKVYNGISLDFYMRVIDAETDAVFTRTHTTNGDHDELKGHFPMKTTGYGFGLRYAF